MDPNLLSPYVAILAPARLGMVEHDVARLATMLLHAALRIASSGLVCTLECQGNLSLHDAAISEQILNYLIHSNRLKQPAKIPVRRPLQKRFKLKSSVRKRKGVLGTEKFGNTWFIPALKKKTF